MKDDRRYTLKVLRGTFKGDYWRFETLKDLFSFYFETFRFTRALVEEKTCAIFDGRKKIEEL